MGGGGGGGRGREGGRVFYELFLVIVSVLYFRLSPLNCNMSSDGME